MQIKEWDPENLEGIRLKTAELMSWREIEYSRDGYMVGHGPGRKDLKVVPSYARDIRAAWEVVEALNRKGAEIRISNHRKHVPEYAVEISYAGGKTARAVHEKISTAICMAFLALGYAASARK